MEAFSFPDAGPTTQIGALFSMMGDIHRRSPKAYTVTERWRTSKASRIHATEGPRPMPPDALYNPGQ